MFITEKRAEKIRKILRKRQKDLQVFSDNVTNPHNFSAILRTSDAVGVLYLYYRYSGEEDIINEEITMGSHKWVIHHKISDKKIKEFFLSKREKDFRLLPLHCQKIVFISGI
ncbi:MAG: hypothetical protein Q9M89_09770 [Persephonella sp.]|nr:hypothetical protein [Persephonella sp.]